MNCAQDQSSTETIPGYHPPTKNKASFAQVLKFWHEHDLGNVVNNRVFKFKQVKQHWTRMDPKAMPSNFSKRKKIVKDTINLIVSKKEFLWSKLQVH